MGIVWKLEHLGTPPDREWGCVHSCCQLSTIWKSIANRQNAGIPGLNSFFRRRQSPSVHEHAPKSSKPNSLQPPAAVPSCPDTPCPRSCPNSLRIAVRSCSCRFRLMLLKPAKLHKFGRGLLGLPASISPLPCCCPDLSLHKCSA